MSWLSQAFGGQQDPTKGANQYYNQIPGQTGKYYDPFIQQGQTAGGKLTGQYDQMTTDPGAFLKQLAGGYQESPGYQARLKEALMASNNASAAGGMLGTPQNQAVSMQKASDLAAEDYDNYLKNVLGLFGQGQEGQQKFQQQGFQGSQDMAAIMAQMLAQQGNNAYSNTAQQNAQKYANWGNLFKGAGALAGGAMGMY